MQIVTLDNLGSSFDIGVITPGKIEVPGAAVLPPLSPVPGLQYVAGAGSAANLSGIVTTLVKATPYALHYRITATWTQGGNARTRMQITNVDATKLFGLSFCGFRSDNNTGANGAAWLGAALIFQNVGASVANPMRITVYFSVTE